MVSCSKSAQWALFNPALEDKREELPLQERSISSSRSVFLGPPNPYQSLASVAFTLSAIIMEVENYPNLKVTTIGGTYFPLP